MNKIGHKRVWGFAMNETLSLGAWIKQRRRALDLTQEQLADRIGYSVETIHKIEAGQRRPSLQVAELLAATLGVPPAERAAIISRLRAALPPTASAETAAASSLPSVRVP